MLAIAAGDLGQAKHVAGLLQVAFAQAEVSGEEASDSTLEGKAGSGRVLLRGLELERGLELTSEGSCWSGVCRTLR